MLNKNVIDEESKNLATASRIKFFNMVIKEGKGANLYDVEENHYIDFLSSASSTNTGHSHPDVVKAIQNQAEKLIQYTPAYFANEVETKLASTLNKIAPIKEKLNWLGEIQDQMQMMPSLNLQEHTQTGNT